MEAADTTDGAAEVSSGSLPRAVWLTAAAVVSLLLSMAGRYGFHRDEFYFLVAGRRLDFGYVDQPPLTPLIARISELVGGTSPVALRVLPAVAMGGVILLAALMAGRLGGGRRAQTYAAFAVGGTGAALGIAHLLSTAAFDFFLWTLATWILVRLLDGADPRWWLALGTTVGVGLQNKHLIGLFAAAVLVALFFSERRRLLASPWPWAGAIIAGTFGVPNLLWQAANDFPQLEMAAALSVRSDGPVAFVVLQVGLLSIVLIVPAMIGLMRLLRSPDLRRWRPLGVTFVLVFAAFLVSGGKAYYVAPLYPLLLAVGAGWFEQLPGRRATVMASATVIGVCIGLFVALPLLPASTMSTLDATGELGETVGWPELIEQVVEIYESIPATDRDAVAIFTGSYGEAGAIDVLGPAAGLPAASSGHNNYWLWGPPDRHGPIIGVGLIGDVLERVCPDVEQVGTIVNPYGVENEEFGLPLFLCLEPQGQLADIWPGVRHYN